MPNPGSVNDHDSDADFDGLSRYEAPSVDEKIMTLLHRIQTARDSDDRLTRIDQTKYKTEKFDYFRFVPLLKGINS